MASTAANADNARETVTKPYKLNGSLTAAFELKGKGKITYSHMQHTSTETR